MLTIPHARIKQQQLRPVRTKTTTLREATKMIPAFLAPQLELVVKRETSEIEE